MSFITFKKQVANRFKQMLSTGRILNTDYDRDEIWQSYLLTFEDSIRQEHNCNLCKSFIRQIGGAVVVDENNELLTIWDVDAPAEYADSAKKLRDYVRSRAIKGIYYHDSKKVGCDKNLDRKTGTVWEHLYIELPNSLVGDLASVSGHFSTTASVLKRALDEISVNTTNEVLELVEANTLYRGQEYRHMLVKFRDIQKEYAKVQEDKRANYVYRIAGSVDEATARIRNTAIGTLLIDIQSGVDLDDAVKAYERVTAPANYKRPTALVTPRMVEDAKKKLESLGLVSALDRRRLDIRDLSASNALYTFRPKDKGDLFTSLQDDTLIDPAKLNAQDVSISEFIEKIIPTAKAVRVLFERDHLGNLVTMTGPVDRDAKSLFKWDNSFAWSYTGGVADSIKEKVRKAGGKVDNVWLRASLAWSNYDDLDLHLRSSNAECYYGNRRCVRLNAHLDVDMNAGGGNTREPVENIYVSTPLKNGSYTIRVNQFSRRETNGDGFDLEIEVNGDTYRFSSPKNPTNCSSYNISLTVNNGEVTFSDTALAKTSSSSVKWGLKTGTWQPVTSITVSPNHWTTPVGNKHWFFIIPGAVSDEQTRPFYNEFLCAELSKERKVTEALSGKIEVKPAEGTELSGLGFSETLRNKLFVEVEAAGKRVYRVKF